MSDHTLVNRVVTDSSDEFESVIQPVAGAIRLAPKHKNQFRANIHVSRLRRVGIALLDFGPMHTIIEPQHNFYCLTVPIVNSCHIKDAGTRREFSRTTAHLLYPDRALDSLHRGQCQLLGVTFMIDKLDDIARKLLGSANALKPLNDCSLAGCGDGFVRSVVEEGDDAMGRWLADVPASTRRRALISKPSRSQHGLTYL